MGEHHEAPAGRANAGVDGEATWGVGCVGAAPGLPVSAGYDAGVRGIVQQSAVGPPQGGVRDTHGSGSPA